MGDFEIKEHVTSNKTRMEFPQATEISLTDEDISESDPIMMIVVIAVGAMLLVLISLIIAYAVYRLRDRWRARNKEPVLLTFCTTIDSLHRYWTVDTGRGTRSTEVPTLLIRGRADGSSISGYGSSMDEIVAQDTIVNKIISEDSQSHRHSISSSSLSDRCGVHEVQAEINNSNLDHKSNTVEADKSILTIPTPGDEAEDHQIRDLNSETLSNCHSICTYNTNFTEMSTDFTKSCEGIPYIDDDFEFNCEDNIRATTRLCQSADCLAPTNAPSTSISKTKSRNYTPQNLSISYKSSNCTSSRLHSDYTSGTVSTGTEFDEGDKMLGVHSNVAVLSLSQMSINVRSCPNSPICKREENEEMKRSLSKEYEMPFSFSESLLYCLPDVNMLTHSFKSNEEDQNKTTNKNASNCPSYSDSEISSWEMKTSF